MPNTQLCSSYHNQSYSHACGHVLCIFLMTTLGIIHSWAKTKVICLCNDYMVPLDVVLGSGQQLNYLLHAGIVSSCACSLHSFDWLISLHHIWVGKTSNLSWCRQKNSEQYALEADEVQKLVSLPLTFILQLFFGLPVKATRSDAVYNYWFNLCVL